MTDGTPNSSAGAYSWVTLAAVACLALPAIAEDRALIVGVGDYESSTVSDLVGIDLDMDMMQDAAERLGFAPRGIRTLFNEQATLAGFRREAGNWLAGANEDDRVLLYFSGHGSYVPDDNGDETEDQRDEVLVLHDTRFEGGEMRDFLRDDEFGRLLAALPSQNVLVLIDACHSGTTTKSFAAIGERGQPKFLHNPGLRHSLGSVRARSLVPEARVQQNHVLLSAAADDELAQATRQGSAFTLGVSEAVKAAANGRSLTPRELQRSVSDHILELLDPGQEHTPQLFGRGRLLDANLFFALQGGVGPTRRRLQELAANLPQMEFAAAHTELSEGDNVVLALEVPRSGYLNVVNVNPEDDAVVLFPNAHHADNRVSEGRFSVPGDAMDFDLVARAPFGESITVAFLTESPMNLYQDTLKGRNRNGQIVAMLAPLSAKATARMRSIVVESRGERSYAGSVVVRVSR